MAFSTEQLDRYSRHMLLKEVGLKGQQALADGKVLIIGAGGLGSLAAMYLAAGPSPSRRWIIKQKKSSQPAALFFILVYHYNKKRPGHKTGPWGNTKVYLSARSMSKYSL